MSGLYRDSGVVLRTIKLGEADRIVTVFTQGHGRVRVVAKGIRKTSSKFGARLEPTSHIALQCYRGRELDVITQVETIESNRQLREGYGILTHAVPMLEAVDQVAQEREPNPALCTGCSPARDARLRAPAAASLPPAFFWRLLSLEGFHPMLEACARCEDDYSPLVAFDVDEGGMLCAPCARGGGRPVSPEAYDMLCRMLGGGINGLLAEPPSPAVPEVERLAVTVLEHHIERRLRSATLLDLLLRASSRGVVG